MKELPSRARRIVAGLLESLPGLLGTSVEAMLVELDAEYARRIARGDPGLERDAWIESRRRLAEGRAVFTAAFFEGLQRGFLELTDPRAPDIAHAASGSPPAQRTLSLLDEETVDEEGMLAAIASRHEHRASLSLLLLGQRFGVLLAQPPQQASALPVGPQAFGRAIAGAGRRTGLSLDARMALYTVYDTGFMRRYPEFAGVMDASVDRAGVLPGLAFVPLRPRDVPGHADRGRDMAPTAGAAASPESEAVRIVNEAIAQLRQAGRLPESLSAERRETIAAMTRFLLRHGPASDEWKACVATARGVLEAASRREAPPPEARAWIEGALRSVGYSGDEARRLAEGLTSLDGSRSAAAPAAGSGNSRNAREMRCRERLATLPIGTQLGFSSRAGLVRSRVRYFYPDPGLFLLAGEDGQEALFEIDAVARQMAEGQAWVIRSRPPEPPSPEGGAGPATPGKATIPRERDA
jgi:hypothetical protein